MIFTAKFSIRNLISRCFASLFLLSSIIFFLYSCSSTPKQDLQKDPPPAFLIKKDNEVSVMAMNVENLFDTEHDEGKDDYAYLPKALKSNPQHIALCQTIANNRFRDECLNNDWNEATLKVKFENLTKVVLDLDGGAGPDILMLSEVENQKVLNRWRTEYLGKANYKTMVLLEGPDIRGIDVALFSRLDLARPAKLIPIDVNLLAETDKPRAASLRPFLIVPLKLDSQSVVNIIVGHLPSQANPHSQRVAAIMTLKKIVADIEAKNELFIAGGDFNITYEENEKSGLFSKTASEFSLVSHLIGCKKCEGTHYYRGSWSFLDVLLFSKKFQTPASTASPTMPWSVDIGSIDVIRYNPVHLRHDTPRRFDEESKSGVSDHFPIYARIKKN